MSTKPIVELSTPKAAEHQITRTWPTGRFPRQIVLPPLRPPTSRHIQEAQEDRLYNKTSFTVIIREEETGQIRKLWYIVGGSWTESLTSITLPFSSCFRIFFYCYIKASLHRVISLEYLCVVAIYSVGYESYCLPVYFSPS